MDSIAPAGINLDPVVMEKLLEKAKNLAVGESSVQLAIGLQGKLVAFHTFGNAPFAGELKRADNNSLFSIFSCTKILISAAIWILLQEGKLALDELVSCKIPEFKRHNLESVKVRQLLLHTAGFPSASFNPFDWKNKTRAVEIMCSWL